MIIDAVGQTFNTIIGTAVPCQPGPSCSWQASMVGGWVYGPDYEPTGEEIFAPGAGANKGSYSNAEMDKLIAATNTSNSLSVYHAFATYAAQQTALHLDAELGHGDGGTQEHPRRGVQPAGDAHA